MTSEAAPNVQRSYSGGAARVARLCAGIFLSQRRRVHETHDGLRFAHLPRGDAIRSIYSTDVEGRRFLENTWLGMFGW